MTQRQLNIGFEGLVTMIRPPPTATAEESALWQELWSKLRWAIGSTLQLGYTKRSGVGEIARRFAAVSLEPNNRAQL